MVWLVQEPRLGLGSHFMVVLVQATGQMKSAALLIKPENIQWLNTVQDTGLDNALYHHIISGA